MADLPRARRTRLDPVERFGIRLTLIGIAIVLVAIPFATLTFSVLGDGLATRFDGPIADRLNEWVNGRPVMVDAFEWISRLGKPITLYVVVALFVVLLWRLGRHRICWFVVVTSLGGGIVDTLVKAAVDRPRPVVDHPVASALGKSFPSGHAMSSTVTYGAILVAVWPLLPARWRPLALASTLTLVLAIGTSRLFLGVHFLTDVIGGFVLGLAWLSGAAASFQAWRHDEVVEAVVTGVAHPEP